MSKISVLLADSEAESLEKLQIVLEDHDFDVSISTNGEKAWNWARETRPDLVITDLALTELSGIEFIRRIRKLKSDTIIIVLTGHGTFENAIEALRLDVFDFLTKPLDLDIFKSALDRARTSIQSRRLAKREEKWLREQGWR